MTTTDTTVNRFDSERVLGLVNYGLLFSSVFFAGVPALVAVILAYVQRPSAGPAMREHYRFQIWIFWISVLLGAIAGVSGIWAMVDVVQQARGGADFWVPQDIDFDGVRVTGRMILLFVVAGLALVAMTLWMLIAPTVGFIRLIVGKA
jgi:uncharacterized membrane protein